MLEVISYDYVIIEYHVVVTIPFPRQLTNQGTGIVFIIK